MKPSCLENHRLLFVLGMLLLFACSNHVTKAPIFDRSKLTEEEKRLPGNALSAFKVADGLQVELFASEPRMTNPYNVDIDYRGRVWLTEGYNYRFNINTSHPHKDIGDRILILEATR